MSHIASWYHSHSPRPIQLIHTVVTLIWLLQLPLILLTFPIVIEGIQALALGYIQPILTSAQLTQITQQSMALALQGQATVPTVLTLDEQAHLLDVYHYLSFLPIGRLFTVVYLGIIWRDRHHRRRFTRVFLMLSILLVFLGGTVIFFNPFFGWFHQVLFPQGNWQFPATSVLIQAFPPHFWQSMVGAYGLVLLTGWSIIGWRFSCFTILRKMGIVRHCLV